MNIRITEDNKIEIEMEKQLMENIEDLGEELEEEVTLPAQHHLFYVNGDAWLLDENKKDLFTAWQQKN